MPKSNFTSKIIDCLSAMFSMFFESMAGRNIFLMSLFLLFFSLVNYQDARIILPKILEDTVGDIPIIEHFDDGQLEVVETPREIVFRDRVIYRDNNSVVDSVADNFTITTVDFGYFYR